MGNSVNEKIIKVIQNNFEVDIKDSVLIGDKKLLGKEIGMEARDLLCLFVEIEEEFGIKIPQEDIIAGKFNTINNITQIVENQLQKKQKDAV